MRLFQQQKLLYAAYKPYQTLLIGYVLGLVILSLSRGFLFIWHWDRVSAAGNVIELLALGLRADVIQMGYLTLPILLMAPLLTHKFGQNLWLKIQVSWLVLALSFLIFMEAATPAFILQYDLRPNRLFIEYLNHPQEVFSTLWGGFKFWVIASTLILALSVVLLIKVARHLHARQKSKTFSFRAALILWPLLVVLEIVGIRSTLAHRPANPAFFAVTSDALVNDLIINSAYSVEYAVYNLRHEADAAAIYGEMPIDEMLAQVRAQPYLASKQFPNPNYPTLHFNQASVMTQKPKNIVVILEESLGATFVESLGGIPVTPNLEQLKSEGWWFTHLYATGTRSVRGIEAVISSFMPTPARSTVKLSLSQQNFYTAASLLAEQGYFTEFLYGGETHFDNMQSFFSGNGFQSTLGIESIKNPEFVGSWGASDGDLFQLAHQRFSELAETDSPFFSLVFTSSNHEPFEFPNGTIEPYNQPLQSVENAVKYADYALGKFIQQAKQSNYWEDTIFLIVADHDTRVYGDELVPIDKFHIPGLILGHSLAPRIVDSITSQIDLMPTVISLAGVSSLTPALGQDLSSAEAPPANRAMMQFGSNYAWLTDNTSVILTPNGAITGYYDFAEKRFVRGQQVEQSAVEKARAHALLPSWLYRNRAYDTGCPSAVEITQSGC
ncbi:sulfatase [Pseudidiomarina aestuarii]|uniref:Sulfatase n=1 Tax=Pseudidiomarina aestuarii TaxID=624146 RepID=A0A7Z6ZS80_9GAMM|nr:LTA synthase family protein [Pseudidiomarina aestuarii]RUO39436.1 sulfatase [Pseudidiomarina aestuarii]